MKNYYTENPDGSIANAAYFRFSERCLETEREIKDIGGKLIFADEAIGDHDQTVASASPSGYNDDSGGGVMSEHLGERMARIEVGFGYLEKEISEIKTEIKASRRHVTASIIGAITIIAAIIIGFSTEQSKRVDQALGNQLEAFKTIMQHNRESYEKEFAAIRESIDVQAKALQDRTDQFRHESDRNFELALKALERPGVAEGKGKANE